MGNQIRTTILLAVMTALILWVGLLGLVIGVVGVEDDIYNTSHHTQYGAHVCSGVLWVQRRFGSTDPRISFSAHSLRQHTIGLPKVMPATQ